jgi:signal transduction histidine kinase/ligand-binding sensor domain-containing protein
MRSQFGILLVAGVILGFCPQRATAGDAQSAPGGWLARVWQTDEGLPDNNVTGVEQTADGFLWVATPAGLMRFDGARFEEFSTDHLPKVPTRGVRRMLLGRGGRLWLATDRGALIRVDEKSARVFTSEEGVYDARVACLVEETNGVLWAVCGSVVCRIEGDKVEQIGAEQGLPEGGGSWFATDERGQLWFARGTQLGVAREGRWVVLQNFQAGPLRFIAARGGGVWVSDGSQVFKFGEGGKPQPMASLPNGVVVRCLLEDRTGRLWVGTAADGLFRLQGREFTQVAVSHSEISALLQDLEGNLWVGTAGGGFNLLRLRAMEMVTTKSGLPFESVRSVCEDAEGWMWAALANGALARGRGSQWSAVTDANGWPGGNAMCVAPARGGGVWIGTRDRGLQLLLGGKIQEWGLDEASNRHSVRSLMVASNGDLWIATDAPSRLQVFRAGAFQPLELPPAVRSIRALAESAPGTIWAGTSDGQVLRVQGREVVNETETVEEKPLSVRCLHAAPDGSLLIGYAGWGLGRWHEGKYKRIGATQGLNDDYVAQILTDGTGGLWLTGNHGLFQVRLDELVAVAEGRSSHLRSIAYGRNEGLPSLQPVFDNTPAAWRAADGQLWFSARKGLLVVSPKDIPDNPTPPPVVLTAVKVDDNLMALHDSQSPLRPPGVSKLPDLRTSGWALKLPPRHTKIEFAFTALSFNSPENVHFRYRLIGFDREWVEAGTQRAARYPRLLAGRYDFEVTACNEAGVWSATGFRFPFVVQPFYWQTLWFRLGALAAFTASVIGAVRYFSYRRLRRELEHLGRQAELQKERTRIARDMHDEVGSKLSRLSLLSEMASHNAELPPEARSEVAEISETARETIRSFEEIVWAVNPKNDSLPNLFHYLCRFAEDFFEGSEVHCAYELPEQIPDVEVPTELRHHVFLAGKEALNNVLKHAGARLVCVRLKLVAAGFEIQIEDDGQGFPDARPEARPGTGYGLENMRERMRQAGGQCDIQTRPGQGTHVTLRLPCPQLNPP